MRSTNRKRLLLVSSAIIMLCMTVIVGMTWALFTDTQNVYNHLQAGDLAITLKRTELTKTTLNANGKLVTSAPDTNLKNFSNPTDENVFGLVEGEKVVPGTKYVAKMQIENHSDVAFGYWVKIDCKDEDVAKTLAKQLKIIIYTDKNGDGTIDTTAEGVDSTVATGLEVGSDKDYIGTLECGKAENFIVSVEFIDTGYTYKDGVLTSTNDDAQTQSVEFDLLVYAIQATH